MEPAGTWRQCYKLFYSHDLRIGQIRCYLCQLGQELTPFGNKCSTQAVSGLNCKHCIKLEKLARDEHSSLFGPFVNYATFLTWTPGIITLVSITTFSISTLSIKTLNTGMLSVPLLNVVYTECSRLGQVSPRPVYKRPSLHFLTKNLYRMKGNLLAFLSFTSCLSCPRLENLLGM